MAYLFKKKILYREEFLKISMRNITIYLCTILLLHIKQFLNDDEPN